MDKNGGKIYVAHYGMQPRVALVVVIPFVEAVAIERKGEEGGYSAFEIGSGAGYPAEFIVVGL